MDQRFLPRNEFHQLIDVLLAADYSVIGPQVQNGAIVYDSMTNVDQLPKGFTDAQEAGQYSLHQSNNPYYFSWAAAAQSIKPLCFKPKEVLWKSSISDQGTLNFTEPLLDVKPTAIIGVKACDIAALKLQDQHFLEQEYVDPTYKRRRESLFIISVDCAYPAATCFCHSTNDGPTNQTGFDINLTELENGFIISTGTDAGQSIVDGLQSYDISVDQLSEKSKQEKTAINQQRKLPHTDIAQTLKHAQDHQQWDDIAQRCLACGNCTAVCPSCFCHSEHDEYPLNSPEVSHVRQWDSCFNHGHSYIHGIVIRSETRNRYRQWLTHKFANWVDQYGRSGCTGCGRCISWCPVGIDVTQELAVICGEEDA